MYESSPSVVEVFMSALCRLGLVVLSLAMLSTPASAQQKKAVADPSVAQALRKAQGALQQLSEQNAQLSDEVTRLRAQLEALAPKAKQLEKAERELSQQAVAATDLRDQYRALVERTHRDAARIAELQEAGTRLNSDNGLLKNAVVEREQWIGDCSKKNSELRQLNGELLEKYRNKGLWQALKNAEPVTGIAAVSQEREEQAYRFRLEDLSYRRDGSDAQK
jgi:predicted nuclease with TOPRIM domain